MSSLEFPRDRSGNISKSAINKSARTLLADFVYPACDNFISSPSVEALEFDLDGSDRLWNVKDVVLMASAAAFLSNKTPDTDYDAALIKAVAQDLAKEYILDIPGPTATEPPSP